MSLELRVPPVLQVAVAALLMFCVDRLVPGPRISVSGAGLLIPVIASGGIGIALLGALSFRRATTTVDPRYPAKTTQLVTDGVYRFTRNPMYLGMSLALVAWALYLENPLTIAVLVAFMLYLSRFQIQPEERVMSEKFGEEFGHYRSRVRRWL